MTLLALGGGVLLAVYDLRTDDTGIEVGLLLIASLALAAISPRRWWLVALCVGLPIPLVELASGAVPPAGAFALGFTIAGSLIGFGISRARSAA
ncbi:MAG TPA: hypothetical protein VHG53_04705 [Candidatus Limnocylindria bacterium]|nr:hypothetical protein [Candidatus Limnocylindria bacterium]